MKKFKKFIPLLILVVVALAILVWACNKTEKTVDYDHEGYVIAMKDADEGTILTVLNGDTKSEFVVKQSTKENYNGGITQLQEGDYIKLITTRNSDRDIKEFSAYSAFSTEGTVFYAEGHTTPFLLTPYYASYRVYSLIFVQEPTSAPQTGTPVKVYYQHPVNAATVNIVTDGILATGETAELSTEELEYIEKQEYTIIAP